MTKIILSNGEEDFVSPGAAQSKVAAGDATWPPRKSKYITRELVAGGDAKPKRHRRTKAQIAADNQDTATDETD